MIGSSPSYIASSTPRECDIFEYEHDINGIPARPEARVQAHSAKKTRDMPFVYSVCLLAFHVFFQEKKKSRIISGYLSILKLEG